MAPMSYYRKGAELLRLPPDEGTTMKADYAWQEPYEAAVLETDDGKLAKRLPLVRAGLDSRLQQLQMDHQVTCEERQAISDALKGLDLLRERTRTRSHETELSKA
jgi:hypothetical protein